jgi:hypothetical protein
MSYARDSKASDEDTRTADFNHFVIFDPRNLLACHGAGGSGARAGARSTTAACPTRARDKHTS